MNLHIIFFSVLLACTQSFIQMNKMVSEEEVKCEDAGSDKFSNYDWSLFENHITVPDVTKEIEPNFHLYRRGSILDHVVVLIHGFGSKKGVWAGSMKDEIFENDPRENLAVLTVDWSKGASASLWDPAGSYNKAVANTRYIGLATQKMVSCLERDHLSETHLEVHCIGHSLGAHVCGFLGNALEASTGSKMFRVSGLDPAGPQFTTELVPGTLSIYKPLESYPRDQRLDETDAQVVDVVHTDGNQWGTMRPLGDVDFYVGKSLETLGTEQAGCEGADLCDHSKSIKFYRESIQKKDIFKDILECEIDSELRVQGCRETERKPQFGYFYKHGQRRGRGRVFGVLDKELEVKKDTWDEEWDDDWDEDEEEVDDEEKEEERELVGREKDSRKTTSEATVETAAANESQNSNNDVNRNHLQANTETDYHVHIGGISLSRTHMILISIAAALLCLGLGFLAGRFLRLGRASKQTFVPDASQEVLLPV